MFSTLAYVKLNSYDDDDDDENPSMEFFFINFKTKYTKLLNNFFKSQTFIFHNKIYHMFRFLYWRSYLFTASLRSFLYCRKYCKQMLFFLNYMYHLHAYISNIAKIFTRKKITDLFNYHKIYKSRRNKYNFIFPLHLNNTSQIEKQLYMS